jgi:predicted RecB family nuclease
VLLRRCPGRSPRSPTPTTAHPPWLGEDETIRLSDVDAYWRRIRGQLRALVESDHDADTEPEPCTHCEFCEFADICDTHWREQDALHYVAGIRTTDIANLRAADVTTLTALADRTDEVDGIRPERLATIRKQADLQRAAVEGQPPPFETLPIADEADPHRTLLPTPDDGDIFLDYEGHPFWSAARGLFFLFGLIRKDPPSGNWVYEARWAHEPKQEGRETRALIDWIAARRASHPGMHVYHYNHTERSSLERLATEYGAGEQILAELLKQGVFVDLLDVLRRRIVVGAESYSLKTLELLAAYQRGHDIDQGAGAIVEYDAWCHDGDDSRLVRIARYNEDDVRATLAVRDWLLSEPLAHDAPRPPAEPGDDDDDTGVDQLVADLIATGEDWKVLLGHLLEYWNREGRAHWAQHAALLDTDPADQLAHPEVIARLEFAGTRPPEGRQKDDRAVFTFPPQELDPDILSGKHNKFMFPIGTDGIITITADSVDPDTGELVVCWSEKTAELDTYPTAVVVNDWVGPKPKPDALREFAERALAGTTHGPDLARIELLRRRIPRFAPGHGPTDGQFTPDLNEIIAFVPKLSQSYLAVQGPPGTGKTYTGAHIIKHSSTPNNASA